MVTSAKFFMQLSQAFVELATPLLGPATVIKNNVFSASSVSYLLAPLRNRIICGEALNDRGYELFYIAAGHLAHVADESFRRSKLEAVGQVERAYATSGKVVIKLDNGYAQDFGRDVLVSTCELLSESSRDYFFNKHYFANRASLDDDFWYLLDVIRLNSPLALNQVTSDALCMNLITSNLVLDLIEELGLDEREDAAKEFAKRVVTALVEYPGRGALLSRAVRFLDCIRVDGDFGSIIELLPSITESKSPVLRELGLIIQLICGENQSIPQLQTNSFGPLGIDLLELANERWHYLRGQDSVAPSEFIIEITEEWSRQSNQVDDESLVVTSDPLFEHFFLLANTMISERQEIASSLLAKYPRDEIAKVIFAKSLLTSPSGSDGEKILQTMIDEDKVETSKPYMTLFYHMLSYGRVHEASLVVQAAMKKWPNEYELIDAACELNSVGCTRRVEYENYIGC